MISASPHLYRNEGLAQGRDPELLNTAVVQASGPESRGLPAILTLRHLAHRMEIDYLFLREVVTDVSGTFYRDFLIKKRSGGFRTIVVPEPRLMAVQRWIARELLKPQPTHPNSFAYARNSSIKRCAERHLAAGWLVKFDIHEFFESIVERRVFRVFHDLGYQPLVAFELARLCTRPWNPSNDQRNRARLVANYVQRGIAAYQRLYTGYLPQGAPTSPMLSNLVSRALDKDLEALALRRGLTVTRYSDDLTFSAPMNGLDRSRIVELIGEVRAMLLAHEFRLHEAKIAVVPPGARKVVLGLLVDRERVRLPRAMKERIAMHVRGVEKFGPKSHAEARRFAAIGGMVAHIEGLLRFAQDIEPDFAEPLHTRFVHALAAAGWHD